MRHPTRAAIDKLNRSLGLIEEPYMQDWELECSDPTRLDEFIAFYDAHTESEDEKFTLMALILGSFEDFHGGTIPTKEVWTEIRSILVRDIGIHRDHIEYYQCLDTESEDDCFPITQLMRQIEISKEPEQVVAPNRSLPTTLNSTSSVRGSED